MLSSSYIHDPSNDLAIVGPLIPNFPRRMIRGQFRSLEAAGRAFCPTQHSKRCCQQVTYAPRSFSVCFPDGFKTSPRRSSYPRTPLNSIDPLHHPTLLPLPPGQH
eukprot:9496849-Pyramimonas_sp.AAC.2